MPISRPRIPMAWGTASLLVMIALASAACTQGGANRVDGGAAAKEDALAQVASLGRLEAQRELGIQEDHDIGIAEAGLDRANFLLYDQNADGRLSASEQTAVFRQVWDAMMAIANARAADAPPEATTAGVKDPGSTTEYSVAHPLKYAPTQAEVFIDAAEIMPAVFHTLEGATKTIRMDLYLLGGTEGQKLAEVLAAKARAGVDVRLIHDPAYGMAGTTYQQVVPVIKFLLSQGVSIKSYPIRYMPRRHGHPFANKFQIDHDKFLVVDREVAMIGTMNLIDIGVMNHDLYLRITGDAANELAAIHDATWQLKGALPPDLKKTAAPALLTGIIAPLKPSQVSIGQRSLLGLGDPALARVTKTDIDQTTTKKILLEAFRQAKRSIHVGIFEFGDVDVAQGMIDAYKRGVDVKVLADKNSHYGKYLDALKALKLYGTPNLLTTNRLREAGVPVKWYIPQADDQELHMKMAVVDGERVLVGSTNYTYQAFRTFRETNVDLLDPAVAGRIEAMFQRDWETRGVPVTKPTFFEKTIMAVVKVFDQINLSWW